MKDLNLVSIRDLILIWLFWIMPFDVYLLLEEIVLITGIQKQIKIS